VERLLRWLDDFDDLLDVFRLHARSVAVTLLLATAFLTGMGLFLLAGAPDLLAAP
jgi:hypothetical protein